MYLLFTYFFLSAGILLTPPLLFAYLRICVFALAPAPLDILDEVRNPNPSHPGLSGGIG